MARPDRKTRGVSPKRGRTREDRDYSRRPLRKHSGALRPPESDRPIDLPELLSGLLSIDKYNQAVSRTAVPSSRKRAAPRERSRMHQDRRKRPRESSDAGGSSESDDGPGYTTESGRESGESLPGPMDVGNSTADTSSTNSTASTVGSTERVVAPFSASVARAPRKNKSFMRMVDGYIKAAIEEGKRQAKKYIRKALSFGVTSGYLVPADDRWKVLRVSSSLVGSRRKADVTAREGRRKVRRGETGERAVDGKPLRRATTASTGNARSYRNASTNPAASRKQSKIATRTANASSDRRGRNGTRITLDANLAARTKVDGRTGKRVKFQDRAKKKEAARRATRKRKSGGGQGRADKRYRSASDEEIDDDDDLEDLDDIEDDNDKRAKRTEDNGRKREDGRRRNERRKSGVAERRADKHREITSREALEELEELEELADIAALRDLEDREGDDARSGERHYQDRDNGNDRSARAVEGIGNETNPAVVSDCRRSSAGREDARRPAERVEISRNSAERDRRAEVARDEDNSEKASNGSDEHSLSRNA